MAEPGLTARFVFGGGVPASWGRFRRKSLFLGRCSTEDQGLRASGQDSVRSRTGSRKLQLASGLRGLKPAATGLCPEALREKPPPIRGVPGGAETNFPRILGHNELGQESSFPWAAHRVETNGAPNERGLGSRTRTLLSSKGLRLSTSNRAGNGDDSTDCRDAHT
jgi:hypothetical protein